MSALLAVSGVLVGYSIARVSAAEPAWIFLIAVGAFGSVIAAFEQGGR